MKLKLCSLACLMALGTYAQAAPANDSDRGYFRAPALHDNTLVFTAEGDLWTQKLGQEQASRLTSLPALETGAAISADGQWVAFEANYDGTTEAYVIPLKGGQAKRVSFENSRVRVQGWTPDGQVLYATDNAAGASSAWVLRSVSPETLITRDIPLSDAIEGVVDSKGEQVFFTRFGLQATGDNTRVYRGGAMGQLWRYQLGSGKEALRLAADHQGSLRQPMLWQDRLYFISDASGVENIWSMDVNGGDIRQHTRHKDFAIRGARMNEGRIAYQLGADVQVFDIASGKDTVAELKLTSDYPYLRGNWVNNPMDYMTAASFSHDGDKAVVTARSKVVIAGSDGSRVVEVASPDNSRLRNAVLSKDGNWVYAISDASGEQEIWRFAADGSEGAKQLTKDGASLRMNLHSSPDGRYIAHDDYQGNVWLLDLNKGSNKLIVKDGEGLGPYADIVWGPDSGVIALTKSHLGQQRPQILLYGVDSGKSQFLTSDKYESFSPAFSPDGQWLYFLSNRHFKATPSSPWGDRNMGPVFDRRTQVFALALDKDARFPFQKPNELLTDAAEKDEGDVKVKVDWQGLNERLWQVPLAPGNYSSLSVLDGKLYLMDSQGGKRALKVVPVEAGKANAKVFAEDIAGYRLSADGKKLLLGKQSKPTELLIVDAGDAMPGDLSSAKVNTSQWQLLVEPEQEFQQMFEDAWLMHREQFFDKKMRGLDWNALKDKYQPLVDRVTDRHELNDVFVQMMAELDALHSQVRGGELPKDPEQPKAASLGARFKQTSDGVIISQIYRHDAELPEQASPLARPGVDAKEGDELVAINGKPVNTVADINRLLRNQRDVQVLLELKRKGNRFKTIVEPVNPAVDGKLRYLDWVNSNREKVNEASNDEFGYLHLYAMGGNDIASFAREFYTNYDKPGLIIDVRRNRGGNIDSWVIEKLLRRAWAFWAPTRGTPNTNMQQTFRGHLVVLTDQLTYSDGETFSAGIKALELAPLIGKQTAGAGVWLSGRNSLTDKGMARVAEYPQYAMDGRWVLEGRGVSPDIEVENLPHATFMGEDAQLDKAIEVLKQTLKQEPIPELKPLPISGQMADDISR
ncbi:S41 family peptidase [Shewanella submarina]|uniref:Tricorn protease homolog n=1 Tax=Shewanella submarina TaxID=2016376 RepID=A0ABV7GEV6_9GAMM|nr:S41 family peptidase [Shewanella submarina]MCL1037890.1 S41 family peptidase [Shewanella submarina]